MADSNFQKLLVFQAEAAEHAFVAYSKYDPQSNRFSSGLGASVPTALKGRPKPYLHRIKAVTGAGKTPVLAAVAAKLKNCVVLWTTPRGAVISQTTEALAGKYARLFPENTRVFELSKLLGSTKDWQEMLASETGCTIITATVASFNQDSSSATLNIYKGAPSHWDQLCGDVKRDKWVFYDEGHNVTDNQFNKLLELQPKGFMLASASPLPEDLYKLIPGDSKEDQELEFNEARSTVIDTAQVVKEGLLKAAIKIHDHDTSADDILKAAVDKREYLGNLCEDQTIACYIVDRDAGGLGVMHGLSIWEKLVALNVPKHQIAVHLSGARDVAEAAVKHGQTQFAGLVASYDSGMSPSDLKARGFRHIIWNLSLQEGWDEPWAYVGYFHGEQRDVSQVIQRIGRLIRNPFRDDDGMPALPEELLREVHVYLRTPNDLLKQVVSALKKEMDTSGIEVFVTKESKGDIKSHLDEVCRNPKTIERLCLTVDRRQLQTKLFSALTRVAMHDSMYLAKGSATTVTYDVLTNTDSRDPTVELPAGVLTTVGEVVRSYLDIRDARLVRVIGHSSTGAWLDPNFWSRPEFKKEIHVASPAHAELKRRCDEFLTTQLGLLVKVVSDGDQDFPYEVGTFRQVNPNGGATPQERARYAVHEFKHSLHKGYNGLNPLEVDFANAIDATTLPWARNPANTGYGIPLVHPIGSSTKFFPDFIVWSDDGVIFFETKGNHLWESFKAGKLMELPDGFTVVGITEQRDGYFAVRKANGDVYEEKSDCLADLLDMLMN
jgi:type III restriction enzyme